jgi:hypothetical protein
MARLFDTATLQPIEIPDEDAPAHILSGRYGLEAGKEVMLHRPDGGAVAVRAEEAQRKLRLGYTFASQEPLQTEALEERFGPVGGRLLSASAGVARGLTFGLSDQALRHAGVESDTLRTLDEGAPEFSTGGQVVGSLAPLLLSGGASAAAEGVSAAGALPRGVAALGSLAGKGAARALAPRGSSLLAKVGTKAIEHGVGGAVEGAAYGAGHALTEDALGRADLNAESLIANVGLGALVGGGASGLLGGLGFAVGQGLRGGAKMARDRLSASGSIGDWLEGIAGDRALKATLGQQKRAFTQLEDKNLTEKAKKYLLEDLGLGSASTLDSFGNTTEKIAEKLAARRSSLGEELEGIVARMDEATASEPLARVSPRQVASRIKEKILPKIDKSAQRSAYETIERYADDLAAEGNAGLSFAEAAKKRAATQANANYDSANPGPLREQWAGVARLWNDTIDETAEPVLKGLGEKAGKAYKKAREEFALVQRLTDYAENRVQGNAANRFVSPSDYGIGAAVGVASGGASGLVAAAGHKLMRERGGAMAAAAAYKLSRLEGIGKAAEAVAGRIGRSLDDFVAGRRRGEGGRFLSKRSSAPLPIAATSLAGVSFGAPAGVQPQALSRRDAAKQRSKELAQLMADPGRVADRIAASTAGLDEAAPNIATQAALVATKALQFLHAKAPKSTQSTHTAQPLLDDWEPSDAEASQFERYMKAALDPVSVLDDLANGTITQEGAETLRELYPQLREMALGTIAAKLSESRERLPYADRVNLSILFGVPADDTMRPEFIARLQKTWTPTQNAPVGQSAGGGGNLGMADNMRTSTQRLEVKP